MWRGVLVPARRYDDELMDRPGNSRADLEAALGEIRWVNRWLGGSRALLDAWRPLLDRVPDRRAVRVLDVGTGGADLPLALVREGRSAGREVHVAAVDLDATTAAIAAREVAHCPEIHVVRADARALPFAPRSVDFVTASLFLHHFDERDAVELLRGFLRVARVAVLVNDLRRHRVPWAFIWLVGRLTRRHPMFRHDGPLSVLRGFTPAELVRLGAQAGARKAGVRRRWPYRLALTLEPAP